MRKQFFERLFTAYRGEMPEAPPRARYSYAAGVGKPLYSGLCLKGKAVCALYDSGVSLVSADFDFVERAVIIAAAMMLAVLDCAADVTVCKFSTHSMLPFAARADFAERTHFFAAAFVTA